jgi:hypothetical protein
MERAGAVLGLLAFLAGAGLAADPLLTRPEAVGGKILVYPDHRDPKLFYYVPSELALSRSFGSPQFFFYKYVYVKPDAPQGPQTLAGGVLTLTVEFKDETEILKALKGASFEFRQVPIEALTCDLVYHPVGGEGRAEDKEGLAHKKLLWTRKSFTLPLKRETASYLWGIFEDDKATGLSVDCEFTYGGYEWDDEGKLKEGARDGRLSSGIPVSMAADRDLFKLINLADKIAFNYRRLSVLCFDFVNGVSDDVSKITAEIEILTARKQRDFKTVSFSADSDPQVDLEFNIPETKGGKYRYRLTRVRTDGKSERSEWAESDDMFLDLSTYDIAVKDGSLTVIARGGLR